METNIKQNKCEICGIQGKFNKKEFNYGIRCSTHKDPDMINVKRNRCIKCRIRESSYNYEGKTETLYCDDSSEDELIQQTLTRKLKYESSQKVIEEEDIENSDLEDVISMCRRVRHLLRANKQLSDRVRELEKILKDS
jgi:hypothetical protein